MSDWDLLHGNDAGDAKVIRRTTPWLPSVAIWQNGLAEEWCDALGRQVLAGTIARSTWFGYRRNLRLWIRYLDGIAEKDEPVTATVVEYLTWLRTTRPSLTVATLNNRLDTIQAFYRWTGKRAIFPDIAIALPCITDARSDEIPVLTHQDIGKVVDRLGDRSLRDLRDRALLWTLYGGALETISLHRANIRDLHTLSRTLRHQPRGHRSGDVVTTLPRESMAALNRYLDIRQPGSATEPLFTSTRRAVPQRLSTLSMRLTVRRCFDAYTAALHASHPSARVTTAMAARTLRASGLMRRSERLRPDDGDHDPISRAAEDVGYRSTRCARNLAKRFKVVSPTATKRSSRST